MIPHVPCRHVVPRQHRHHQRRVQVFIGRIQEGTIPFHQDLDDSFTAIFGSEMHDRIAGHSGTGSDGGVVVQEKLHCSGGDVKNMCMNIVYVRLRWTESGLSEPYQKSKE